ncbi:MAG: preprotein translocase subunit YajC [Ruminococcaceae bacterium]|nr:preprotein translocase subunit YajC [Oscillospiraceae bacterium]MBQ8324662.1 preprotein translocase subunit YajC [Clostridia bacterium]
MMIGMIVVMVALMYFFVFRPQKKQERETNEMRNSIEIGDVVSTVGGIIGVVVRIKDEMLLIESGADRTRIQIQKWAVRGIEERAHPEAHEDKDGKKLKK